MQPGHAAISLQRAQHAARMRHAQNRRIKEQQAQEMYGEGFVTVGGWLPCASQGAHPGCAYCKALRLQAVLDAGADLLTIPCV